MLRGSVTWLCVSVAVLFLGLISPVLGELELRPRVVPVGHSNGGCSVSAVICPGLERLLAGLPHSPSGC